MVREPLAWNTSPGACEDEPPGAGNSPWSTTVTCVHPRAVSSSASAAPTTPAPMMTTRVSTGRPSDMSVPPGCRGRVITEYRRGVTSGSNGTAGRVGAPGAAIQSVDRAVSVLELLARSGEGVGVGEVAAELGVHKSTASRLLSALE